MAVEARVEAEASGGDLVALRVEVALAAVAMVAKVAITVGMRGEVV